MINKNPRRIKTKNFSTFLHFGLDFFKKCAILYSIVRFLYGRDVKILQNYLCTFLALLERCSSHLSGGAFLLEDTMSNKLSVEEVRARVEAIHGDRVQVDWGSYVNTATKVKCKCNVCGYEWECTTTSLVWHKYGCRQCCVNARKLTIPEVQQKVEAVHANTITVDYSGYKNNRTKIPCTCNICGHAWMSTCAMLIHGRGCRKCFEKRTCVTLEEAQERVHSVHKDNISVDWSNYTGVESELSCTCAVCGYEWTSDTRRLARGSGCAKCAIKNSRLPVEEISRRVSLEHGNTIQVDYSTYETTDSRVKCRCNVCGHTWETGINTVARGHGCPMCAFIAQRMTVEEVMTKVKEVHNNNITFNPSDYVDASTKIQFTCSICGHTWYAEPTRIMRGCRCSVCVLSERTTTSEECLQRLNEIHGDLYTYDLSNYKNLNSKIEVTCKNNHIWSTTPRSLLMGHGCTLCNPSKYEQPIRDVLTDCMVDFSYNVGDLDCINPETGYRLRYDFKIPKENPKLLIELDGEQHFNQLKTNTREPLEKIQYRDAIKNAYAKDGGFVLIRASDYKRKTSKHISIKQLKDLIIKNTKDGVIDIEAFRPYDFNRE